MEHLNQAQIISVYRERYQLYSPEHGEFFAQLKSSVYFQSGAPEFPTAGDWVAYQFIQTGDSQIINTMPRKTYLQRYDAFSQVILRRLLLILIQYSSLLLPITILIQNVYTAI